MIASILMFLFGCGHPQQLTIDPTFQDLISRFEKDGNRTIKDLVVKFGYISTPGGKPGTYVVGECEQGLGTPTVTILPAYWNSATDLQREELMYHELGHCILERDHVEEELSDGCPVSIMDPYTIEESCLIAHHAEYIKELFKGR